MEGEESWPEKWKEGIFVPIMEKKKEEKTGDYRGVTTMPTLYRINTTVLTGRLKEKIERKKMIPNQTGFLEKNEDNG